MTENGLTKYVVTFVVRKEDGTKDHQWSATWWAENFGHAQEQAEDTLRADKDFDSKIERIELW